MTDDTTFPAVNEAVSDSTGTYPKKRKSMKTTEEKSVEDNHVIATAAAIVSSIATTMVSSVDGGM